MSNGILVAKHLRALFRKPEFVGDLRHAAKHGRSADFLIRYNEVGENDSVSVFVTHRNILPVLDALGIQPGDTAVSEQTIGYIDRLYCDTDALQFGQTSIFSGRSSGPQMALIYHRPFPSLKETLELRRMEDNYQCF